jgi:hypothetical protein
MRVLIAISASLFLSDAISATEPTKCWKFSFGGGSLEPGYTQVLPDTSYTKERGYGFESSGKILGMYRSGIGPHCHYCTGDRPFYFSAALPEGNYTVTLTVIRKRQ